MLRRCLTRCRHCRIFFLTHPRNAGRKDLRCPFGCSQAHRRKESIRRSTEYYRGEDGRKYKRRQNERQREKRQRRANAQPQSHILQNPPQPKGSGQPQSADLRPPPSAAGLPPQSQLSFQPPPDRLLRYLRMVLSLIEERSVSRAEILEMLRRVLRQRSMCRRRRADHTVAWLNEQPP